MKSLTDKLDEAADILLAAMNSNEATIGEKTKAFDGLVEYFKASSKKGNGADIPDMPSFDKIRDRIRDNDSTPQ